MKLYRFRTLIALSVVLTCRSAFAIDVPPLMGDMSVGYQVLNDTGEERDSIHLWFPTDVEATDENRAAYGEGTSPHAATTNEFAEGGPFSLIVYSHGELSDPLENTLLVESLASHGFVVAAPTHILSQPAGNASGYLERVPVIQSTIDMLYERSTTDADALFGKIRTDGVGAAGFSLSGHAVKALASGALDDVQPDDRIKAIMSNSAWGTKATPEAIEIPTLLIAGEEDAFDARRTANLDLSRISSEARYMTIFDGRGPCLLDARTCNNEYAQEVQSILSTAFFDKYLRGNDTYSETLTQQFAVAYDPPFGFYQGAETDVNQDKKTDFEDFLVLADLFGKTKLGRQRRVDFNMNGIVDFADFLLLAQNYSGGPPNATTSVPEPTGYRPAAWALAMLLVIRHQRYV